MDKRTQFYLDCQKLGVGLSQKIVPHSNLKNFVKVTQSDEYNAILNSGGIYIGEGHIEDTWVAVYVHQFDEETVDEVELIFDVRPTESAVRFVQFLLSIEDYLSDPRIKPYVDVDGERTHWTLLPFESPEEKWEQYIILRDEQEEQKNQKKSKKR